MLFCEMCPQYLCPHLYHSFTYHTYISHLLHLFKYKVVWVADPKEAKDDFFIAPIKGAALWCDKRPELSSSACLLCHVIAVFQTAWQLWGVMVRSCLLQFKSCFASGVTMISEEENWFCLDTIWMSSLKWIAQHMPLIYLYNVTNNPIDNKTCQFS